MADTETPETTESPVTTNPVMLRLHEIGQELDTLSPEDPRYDQLSKEYVDLTGMRTIVEAGEGIELSEEELSTAIGEQTGELLNVADDLDQQEALETLVEAETEAIAEGVAHNKGETASSGAYSAADPVSLFNGEFTYRITDLAISGAGINFAFARFYRNQSVYNGPLGYNWDHNYNLWIRALGNNLVRSNGYMEEQLYTKHPKFGEDGFNYWVPPDGQSGVIFEEDGAFIWRSPGGMRQVYKKSVELPFLNRIHRIEDRFGNYIEFRYENRLLNEIEVNHPERLVGLSYDNSGRINSVRDFTDRRWRYSYDDLGDLVEVVAPATGGHPNGAITTYAYSSAEFGGMLKHNLTGIVDAECRLYVENDYGSNVGFLSYNRVIRQRLHCGETLFDYADIIQDFESDYSEANKPRYQTSVTQQNGHVVKHVFNRSGKLLVKDECIFVSGIERLLRTRYRYNSDGALRGVLTPEGRMTQYLYGREFFHRRHGLNAEAVIANDDNLTWKERQAFGRLLAVVQRSRTFSFEELDITQGVWGDLFPDIFSELNSADIVVKYSYEDTYGQILTT
ncbi:MAG: DUF6531 domain-containing protein, partial [Verrucomicrobiota bacterium]